MNAKVHSKICQHAKLGWRVWRESELVKRVNWGPWPGKCFSWLITIATYFYSAMCNVQSAMCYVLCVLASALADSLPSLCTLRFTQTFSIPDICTKLWSTQIFASFLSSIGTMMIGAWNTNNAHGTEVWSCFCSFIKLKLLHYPDKSSLPW